MSQHDFDIANQTASNARVDINLALKALGSLSSGPVAPTTTYANMLWYDTGANILKMRSEADDAWISMGYLHQGENQFHILDDTYVSDTSGNHVGLLGDQSTATWQAGTSTTESLVSPAKVKAAVEALAPEATVKLKSIEQLVAGNTIRSQRSLLLAFGEVLTHSFAFIQIGTIRCVTSGTGGGGTWLVTRSRNGTGTTVASGSGVASSTDVSVIPGDSVVIQYTNGSGVQTVTAAFKTDGGNLWPGSGALLENNYV